MQFLLKIIPFTLLRKSTLPSPIMKTGSRPDPFFVNYSFVIFCRCTRDKVLIIITITIKQAGLSCAKLRSSWSKLR
jgi:hypothetical protein